MEKQVILSPLVRFFNLLKVDRKEILSIYVYALFSGIVSLTLPLGIQAIINLISLGQTSTSWVILVGLVIFGVSFRGVMQIMQIVVTENIQQKIFTRSAFEFAFRIPRMKLEAIDKYYMPELVNRFFDTLSIQKGLSKILTDFSTASLQVVFGLILLSLYHPFFIIFSFVLLFVIYLIFRYQVPRGLKTSLSESKYKYEVAYWLEELARTMKTFKIAANSRFSLRKTDYFVSKYIDSRKDHFSTLKTQYVLLVIFKVFITAGLLFLGGILVLRQQMNIGQFVAAEILIILIIASIEKLIVTMETIYDILTAVEKIGVVTDIDLDNHEAFKIDRVEKGLSIALKNVSFTFLGEQKPVISDINLNVSSGEKVVLSGGYGSGKSILLQVIAGLYESINGIIVYNGFPLNNWDKEDLYSYMGENISKDQIFRGTIHENIALGKNNINLNHVREVSDIIGLSGFIESLPDGYKTELISEGRNLPKSIRGKIMLARAIIGTPKLLLLDDTFNNLEISDKQHFLDYVLDPKRNWTVIAVSNNEEVIGQFDKEIVLGNGKIIAEFDKS